MITKPLKQSHRSRTFRRRIAAWTALATLVAAAGLTLVRTQARADDEPPAPTADKTDLLRRQFHEVDGLTIHSLISVPEPAASIPVILIHGLALSGRYMIPAAEQLAATHRVLVPDFPGFGDSDKPDRVLDVKGLADALAAWMDAVEIERAFLAGNSFGCQIIADFAKRYPDRVAASVFQGPTTPPGERSWLQQFIRWQQNSPHNPPGMDEIDGGDYEKTGYVRALRTFHVSLQDRVEEKLPHIETPTLVVRGSLDPICNQEWAEEVTRLLPNGHLVVIPDVAHTLVFTSGPELAEVILPFLRETERNEP